MPHMFCAQPGGTVRHAVWQNVCRRRIPANAAVHRLECRKWTKHSPASRQAHTANTMFAFVFNFLPLSFGTVLMFES